MLWLIGNHFVSYWIRTDRRTSQSKVLRSVKIRLCCVLSQDQVLQNQTMRTIARILQEFAQAN